ncbi:MAG: hypothetical protein BGN88_08265 [Clostridiales bacterium 43-6]|nr:MAG: hypothetical protein BGN88_08265 [Clostridiales bacterium 43-6]
MDAQVILLMIILVPIVGSFVLPILGKVSAKLRNISALTFIVIPIVLSAMALLPLLNEGAPYFFEVKGLGAFSFGFMADRLAVFMALASLVLAAVIVIYSFDYMSHFENQNEYYMMVVLFIGAMMGIVFSTNLVFIYLFWEISAICCWRLIGFFRKKEYIVRADKAFLITVFGAVVMLLGFVLVYHQTGTFHLTQMKGTQLSNTIVILILFGILSKSATLPLHTWLPDAGVAPSPVTSLLHAAILVKIGVYVFARLFILNFKIDEIWHTAIPVIAGISAIVAAGAAMMEFDIKRIIAYSTISQIGFILLGLSAGNQTAAMGGILYILMHGLAKGGLFLCAGIIEHNTGTKDVRQMGGLITKMPVTAVSFLICAFSVMGIPPLGGFFSKYMVVAGSAYLDNPAISFLFIIGAVMTVIYLLRLFSLVFLGTSKLTDVKEGGKPMLASVVILSVLSVLGGLLISFPASFIEPVVGGLIK